MIDLIIDCDTVLYRAAAGCEHKVDWGNGTQTIYSSIPECQQRFQELLEQIISNLKVHKKLGKYKTIMCVSSSKNFRKLLLPSYKSNRIPKDEQLYAKDNDGISYVSYTNPKAKLRKPVGYNALLQWVKESYRVVELPYLEADDTCSLLSSPTSILVSIDKDFCTIPETWFYNYYRDELMYNERDAADYFWLTQCITGDKTDGYSGIFRMGIKKAHKLLDTNGVTWDTVRDAYVDKGYSIEDALAQSRVARILRKGEYENGKIHLWSPEKTFEKTIDTTVEPVVY